jgi:hypothetical protein
VGNAPAVSVQPTVASNTPVVPYLNHALFTCVPEDSTFATNWANSTQPWVYPFPGSLQGGVLEVGVDSWQSRLQSLGATSSEPCWIAAAAHFNALRLANAAGVRERQSKPDVLYLARRTRAQPSVNTVEFSNNTAGRVRVRVNPARRLYATSTPSGALADVTVTADGAKTVTQLATELAALLNAITDFTDHFTAAPALGVVTVTSVADGYPLILEVTASTPGPTMVQVVTTANVAGDYEDDLDDIQEALEFGAHLDVPSRKAYWWTDLQGDDTVNAEGFAWAEAQADPAQHTPIRDYQFLGWSTSGARRIQVGANFVGNFDPTSTDSAAQTAAEANGGFGWSRGSVHDHDRFEFLVPALLGRTIAYLPGRVSFTSKVLQGGVAAAQIQPRDRGDNETLTLGDSRRFNWNSAEGPGLLGSYKWGYRSDGGFIDQKWLEDYIRHVVKNGLLELMQLRNIVTYTDDDIQAGRDKIVEMLASIPAIDPESIGVAYLGRDEVNPSNIVARVYYDYTGTGESTGVINRFGTPSNPLPITIVDG